MANTNEYTVQVASFPAKTNTVTAEIKAVSTTASIIYFADKIVLTISQNGRLAHWLHVPLDIAATDNSLTSSASLLHDDGGPSSDLLPSHHLTATTVLGGKVAGLDIFGPTLATQIASVLLTRDSEEKRMLVLGLGLDKSMTGREEYSSLIGLVLEIL